MSLDYTCYSLAARPLTPRRISAAASGWKLVFADFDSERSVLPQSRALPNECLIWGSRGAVRFDLAALVRKGDRDQLADLLRRNLVGCCELSIESDFDAEPDLLLELSPQQRRLLAQVKSRYDTRSSAGQSNRSWQLQMAVCAAVARVAGGLTEDPQLGTFRAVAKKPA